MQGEVEQAVKGAVGGAGGSGHLPPLTPQEEARQDLERWCDEHELPVPPPGSGNAVPRRPVVRAS
jgi:hypothetical protein